MGWMQQLVETYENVKGPNAFGEKEHPLVPAGFVEKKAAIRVVLTEKGEFRRAERVGKDENRFVIPSTPEAESRVGTQIAPHPLCDELRYVAGDFFEGENPYFDAYIGALGQWCARPDAPRPLVVLRDYLAERRLASDMRASGFTFDAGKDMKSFVAFTVQGIGTGDAGLWERPDVCESWVGMARAREGKRALCYVEGEALPALETHPKFQGNAKLISAKDNQTPFQYKGRFTEASQAVSVSYDASVKAHNTLGWLLRRQGFDRYGMKVVAWATKGYTLKSPAEDDPFGFLDAADEYPSTFEDYGKALKSAVDGLSNRIRTFRPEAADDVVILGMEAATPGRMSINYYQEMPGGEYVKRLGHWYESCAWEIWRAFGKEKKPVQCISTPAPDDIAVAVLGRRSVDAARGDYQVTKSATKLVRQLRMRLLKCTVEGTPLPRDVVLAAFRRASAPQGFTDEKTGRWQEFEWRKTLAVACALIRKEQVDHEEGGVDVVLDENNKDRSYLYGRLLAIEDRVELRAMGKDANRQSNAIRYMQIFQQRPFEIWVKLCNLMSPYMNRLKPGTAEYFRNLIGSVELLFVEDDLKSKDPLNRMYLQGYYCQREALLPKNKKSEGEKDNGGTEE